jgi:hypothetical protein
MDSRQIRQVMRRDRMGILYFRGVYAADQLQKVTKFPSGFIINTDPIAKEGAHWIAIYVDENQRGEFYCSYGRSPETYKFDTWITKNTSSWSYNKKRMQNSTSSVCGHYCLFYLLHRFRKIPLSSLQDMFTNDYALNDSLVNNFISERFNIDTPVADLNFIKSQIARSLPPF